MHAPLHPTLTRVTARIEARSGELRRTYLEQLAAARRPGPQRRGLGCANAAHAYAAMPADDRLLLHAERQPHLAIVTAYNDLLSAHRPYEHYPERIRAAARAAGATAQVAGGVPAMCDGVTQGEPGMELSLFSRDVIALSAAVALSHGVFDAALMLGVCDKIVPGLLIGALAFGHLPAVFVPAGPMTSGLANSEKAQVRQQYAQGLVGRDALLAAEQAAYHGEGTCTFYGTANSNQMLLELMGQQLPGSSFVNPGTPLRAALTDEAVHRAAALAREGGAGIGDRLDARALVNAMVGLLATGGSTNHTLHLVAIARAAGWRLDWDDFAELSACVPLIARVYPNGEADVNHFHAAGGMGFLIGQLLAAGLLHDDVTTLAGRGLHTCAVEPWLDGERLAWRPAPPRSADETVLRPVQRPFSADGGLRLLQGNLGRAIVKVSAVKPQHRVVEAPALVLTDQRQLEPLHRRGLLARDLVLVVRRQGPRANGMPELHKLTPILGALQDHGHRVALVTDGRMSGASGKVPAAIHLSPEAAAGGPIERLRDGDLVRLDADAGLLEARVSAEEWARREPAAFDSGAAAHGSGRELFGLFRAHAGSAEQGGCALFSDPRADA